MEYLNIGIIKTLASNEYIGSTPEQRGTWTSLIGHCCLHENSGVIRNCTSWGDRRWMQTCGVTREEVSAETELFHFEGDDLIIFGYPHNVQASIEAKREYGKLGGRPKTAEEKPHGKPEGKAKLKPSGKTITKPHGKATVEPEGNSEENHMGNLKEGKGKESKGMECKGITSPDGEGFPPARAGSAEPETRELPFVEERNALARSSRSSHSADPLPKNAAEVETYFRGEIAFGRLLLPPDKVADAAVKFFNTSDGNGWLLSNGLPIQRWKPIASNYAMRYVEIEGRFPSNAPKADEDPYAGLKRVRLPGDVGYESKL